jgi:hypothetical protein
LVGKGTNLASTIGINNGVIHNDGPFGDVVSKVVRKLLGVKENISSELEVNIGGISTRVDLRIEKFSIEARGLRVINTLAGLVSEDGEFRLVSGVGGDWVHGVPLVIAGRRDVDFRSSSGYWASSSITNSDGTTDNVLSSIHKGISPVISVRVAEERSVTRNIITRVNVPDEFLGGVVEAEFNSEGVVIDGFFTGVLKLVNKVFMTDLGESSSFFSINVDIVNKERGIIEDTNTVAESVKVEVIAVYNEVLERVKLNPESDFVVLESNKGKGKTRVGVAPENKGYKENVILGEVALRVRGSKGSKFRDITNKSSVSRLSVNILGKFVPHTHPVTVVFIDLRTTNFELDVINDEVTNFLSPSKKVLISCKFILRIVDHCDLA